MRRRSIIAGFLAFALVPASAAHAADAPLPPQTIVVGLDLSLSNPLIKDEGYAARVGARVAQEIMTLPLRSRVMVRTFGSYSGRENGLKVDQVISSHAKPEAVAQGVAELIAHMPALVRDGKLKAQGMTNIVAFLDTMAPVVDCRTSDVRVILATDGFEDSEYGTLTRHGGHLPPPVSADFAGCDELLILGIGQGSGSPSATVHLNKEWKRYAEKAGFSRYVGLYDW